MSAPMLSQAPLGFEEFERDWLRRHRALVPRKPKVSTASEWFWILFWAFVAFGAAVFSGAHTIPAALLTIPAIVPHREGLAVTAFVIVELVIFGAAAGRHEIRWLVLLLVASVCVALVGNNASSARAVAENGGDGLSMVGGFLISSIAPFTALAAGEVLHRQLTAMAQKRLVAEKEFEAAMVDLQARINAAWVRYEKEASKRPQTSTVQPVSREVHEISRENGEITASPKPRVKLHEVARAVHENGDERLSAEELMQKYGIGLGSTTKVREMARSMNGGMTNGNGHVE